MPSRAQAQDAVAAGLVTVGGAPAMKPASLVAADAPVHVAESRRGFVSRGGAKLQAALDRWPIDPVGRDCLDAGASTGGFTDCLLHAGAARVIALDVAYGQLAWQLRSDPRVEVLERTNVRSLPTLDLAFTPDLVVADLSFISLRLVAEALVGVASADATIVALVKPQFEASAGNVGRGGVVRDPAEWRRGITEVARVFAANGAPAQEAMASPVLGPAGNVEFLLWAIKGAPKGGGLDLESVIAEGVAVRGA